MNKKEALEVIRPYIESRYQTIARWASMYAGRPNSIEAYVAALEDLLDYLSDGARRPDGYGSFRHPDQFGEESFLQKMFERRHECRLHFVKTPRDADTYGPGSLDAEYAQEFAAHWQNFLEWREASTSRDRNDHGQEEL